MAIVKMNKFSLFAFEEKREALLEQLQKFEGVQFVNLQNKLDDEQYTGLTADTQEQLISDLEGEQAKIKFALDYLGNYIPKEKGLKSLKEGKRSMTYDTLIQEVQSSNYKELCEQIKQIEQTIFMLKAENAKIETEIGSLTPWGKFDVPVEMLSTLRKSKAKLGFVTNNFKTKFIEELEVNVPTIYYENVNDSKEGAQFLLVVHKEEENLLDEVLKKYGFNNVNFAFKGLCKEQITQLQNKISSNKKSIEQAINDINSFKDKVQMLENVYEYYTNELDKAKASFHFVKTEQTIVIEGWVTQERVEELTETIKIAAGDNYSLNVEQPDNNEEVPVLLKNNSFIKPFESIIAMYGLPKYGGLDPTAIVVPFFMLFYGLMLSDAAYGIIQFVACFLVLKLFKLEESLRSSVKMFMYMSIPTILAGALYGSYFCGFFKISPIWLDPSEYVILVLVCSFGMGIVHIFIGLLVKAYILIKEGKYLDAVYDVGLWIITLATSILLIAGSFADIPAISSIQTILVGTMVVGMVGLVLTQGRENKGIGAKLGAGLYGLYGITGYIGDIVSYSRLMALGLATTFIGGAFNLMISLLGKGVALWIFGPILFIIGHGFNMGINALGAYVHSLRLQYLEFFGKFYESGGKAFTPFKVKNKYINIAKN